MRKLQAYFVFPIASSPIKNGILICEDDGTILELIDPSNAPFTFEDVEVLNGVLCPGFINAHCHLELSHLRGKINEHKGMANFISELLQHRFKISDDEHQQFLIKAENEMLQNGIVAVGDISNFASTLFIKQKGRLHYHTFVEVLGLDPTLAASLFEKGKELATQFKNVTNGNASIVPHAPYTVSLQLLDLINETENNLPISIHLQESKAEIDFCNNYSGDLAELFTNLKFNFSYSPPSGLRPITQVLNHLQKRNNLALIHNTFTTRKEIKWANKFHTNLFWCLCPNANLYIENRLPAIMDFVDENATIIVGTDSLASNHQLSVLEELKTISNSFSKSSHSFEGSNLNTLLTWATLNGARFLQIEKTFGSFEKGKKPGLVLLEGIDADLLLNKNTSVKRIL